MRLIDADALEEEFIHHHPAGDGGLIAKAPTVERIVCRSRYWSSECTHSSSFEQGYTQGYEEGKNDRPKGKWITKPLIYGVTYCSECDFELKINNTNFCPNCGADMRGDV